MREQAYSDRNDPELINEAVDALIARGARIDWLEKASAIFTGQDFDTRVQVPLNLEKDELYKLMEKNIE